MNRITQYTEIGNAKLADVDNAKFDRLGVSTKTILSYAINKLAVYEDMKIPPVNTEIFTKALVVYGGEAQMDMMIEEMAELTKALLKYRRWYRSNEKYPPSTVFEVVKDKAKDVIEEMADVYIMLLQMVSLFDFPGVFDEYVSKKIHRLSLVLDSEKSVDGETEAADK